jgi:hypothetical protein
MRLSSFLVLSFLPLIAVSLAEPAPATPQPQVKAVPAKLKRNSATEEKVSSAPIPAQGSLTLENLIAAALHNNPDIVKRRGDREIAIWAREAAKDFKDPELRAAYGTQSSIDVESPYTESGTSSGVFSGSSYANSSENADLFSRRDVETGNFAERRFTRWERIVTPGDKVDRIVERRYEKVDSNSVGSRNRDQTDRNRPEDRRSSLAENSGYRRVGQTVTERRHASTTQPDENYTFMLRFDIPNLFERAAKIKAATAEIDVAEWELRAVIEATTREVRSTYQKLVQLNVLSKANRDLANQRYELANMSQGKIAKTAGDAADASFESLEARMKANPLYVKLAGLTGVSDLRTRLSLPAVMPIRRVDTKSISADYLLAFATQNNPEYQALYKSFIKARYGVQAEFSKRIPFAAYFDAGLNRRNAADGADQRGYFLRLGISLPLFSNTINRSEDAARAEARAASARVGYLNETMRSQIAEALAGVKMAESELDNAEKEIQQAKVFLGQAQADSVLSDKPLEAITEAKELDLMLATQRVKIGVLYNEAVTELEAAMGVSLDQFMNQERGSK